MRKRSHRLRPLRGSGFRYKCRYGIELTIIAGSSRPRFQAPDVQRPRHRCRCSIDQRRLWGGYCLSATGSNWPQWVDFCRSRRTLVLVNALAHANDQLCTAGNRWQLIEMAGLKTKALDFCRRSLVSFCFVSPNTTVAGTQVLKA
jgi:hypothetical protein